VTSLRLSLARCHGAISQKVSGKIWLTEWLHMNEPAQNCHWVKVLLRN